MGNALDQFLANGEVASGTSNEEVQRGIQHAAAAAGGAYDSDLTFLTFSGKWGSWQTGSGSSADKDYQYDDGALLLVEPSSLQMGHVCWLGGKPAARRMYPASQATTHATAIEDEQHGLPEMRQPQADGTLPAFKDGEGWQAARGLMFYALSGEYAGTALAFSTNAKMAVNSITDLTVEAATRAGRGEEHVYPIVQFESEWVKVQGHDAAKPKFSVAVWVTAADASALYQGDATIEQVLERYTGSAELPAPAAEAPAKKSVAKKTAAKKSTAKSAGAKTPAAKPASADPAGGAKAADVAEEVEEVVKATDATAADAGTKPAWIRD